MRAARAALVSHLTGALVEREAAVWTLDAIDHEEVRRDREAIAVRLDALGAADALTYEHRDSHTEPMLWVADAAAWLASGGRSGASVRIAEVG